jgi:diacylglycerol kinase family enzyme
MSKGRDIWLVANEASGSNDEAALAALQSTCDEQGLRVAHHTFFPKFDLPDPAMLDAGEIDLVAVFAGDGTVNAVVTQLAGWSGAVLILPGGTMNLAYHRLHGGLDMQEVICRAARGECRRVRPGIMRGPHWHAIAGLMAGPGTSWNRVREAMREHNVIEMAEGTVKAIEHSLDGTMIACAEPPLGRPEGYPLILLRPRKGAMDVLAFHSETPREYLDQAFALMQRDFRQGPHDLIGRSDRVVLKSTAGEPFGLLVDGEPAEAGPEAEFVLAPSEVDLLASDPDE